MRRSSLAFFVVPANAKRLVESTQQALSGRREEHAIVSD
jgi:hypothetical protein